MGECSLGGESWDAPLTPESLSASLQKHHRRGSRGACREPPVEMGARVCLSSQNPCSFPAGCSQDGVLPCPIPRAPQVLEAVLWGALVENWLTSRVLQNGSWPGELRSASQVSFLSLGPHCPPHCLTGEGGCQSHAAGVAPSTHSPRFCLEGPWRNRVRGPQPQ